jgi:proliferating cell nuclear antigen PCNA
MKLAITDKKKINQLVTIFRHLKGIVVDVNLILSEEMFYIQSMDGSHACLVEIKLTRDWFDKYTLKEDEVLGINSEILFKVIDCWKEGQEITIYTKNNNNNLFIDFNGEKQVTKKFQLPLIDIDSDIMDIPEKDYDVDLLLKSNDFKELISELSIFNSTIIFKCSSDDEKVIIDANGGMGAMQVEIKDDDILEFAISEDLDLSVTYALSYINTMCSFSKLNDCVYIHSSDDVPMKLHYSLDDKDSSESENYVKFYLAPKIDDDD